VGPGTHCRMTARRPEWFPGTRAAGTAGALLAGLAVREGVALAGWAAITERD